MKKALTILAVVLMVGFRMLQVGIQLASRDILPPDESFFVVERLKVAPEDNAYTYFLQATNDLYMPEDHSVLGKYLAGEPVDEAELDLLLKNNTDCIAQVKKGVACAVCQTPEATGLGDTVPYISPWLDIGKILMVQSRQERLAGHVTASAEAGLLGAQYGNLIQQEAGSLLNYLVGVAIESMALEQILDLGVTDSATEKDLNSLAEGLNRLGAFDAGLVRAFQAEARVMLKTVETLSKGEGEYDLVDLATFGTAPDHRWDWLSRRIQRSRYIFKPNQTKQEFIQLFHEIIRDIPLSYSQINQTDPAKFGRVWTDWIKPNALGRILPALLVPGYRKSIYVRCRAESLLSGTKLAVACNRFERKKGRWPETLDELVPAYLEAVPTDPFDGEPFRYSAEKGIVYSVGANLTDEGGSMWVEGSEDEVATRRNRRKAEDLVYQIRPTEDEKE